MYPQYSQLQDHALAALVTYCKLFLYPLSCSSKDSIRWNVYVVYNITGVQMQRYTGSMGFSYFRIRYLRDGHWKMIPKVIFIKQHITSCDYDHNL